jgi:hypothetical protein
MKMPVTNVDDAVRARLRDAIAVEDVGGEEQQLKGVLRMLGKDVPEQNQLDLFKRGRATRGSKGRHGPG